MFPFLQLLMHVLTSDGTKDVVKIWEVDKFFFAKGGY